MSSGGTESIFLAVHTAREWGAGAGRRPSRDRHRPHRPPGVRQGLPLPRRRAAARSHVGPDLRADPAAFAAALDDQVVLLVGVRALLPVRRDRPRHRDRGARRAHAGSSATSTPASAAGCCRSGSELGEPVPPWDFRVPGVTSLSADVHKYGYTFKGASVILYRDPAMVRRQWFLFDDWPGGLYGSATTAGTRPAAPIAGAWATIRHLGADGYLAQGARGARHHPPLPRGHRGDRRASSSPAGPTCRCSSSAGPEPSTSARWATSWTSGAGTSTASRVAST